MTDYLRHPATIVWCTLAGVTAVSWMVGADHGNDAPGAHVTATVAVLLFAFVKVRLIIYHFMEVKHAPWVLQRICDAWVAVVCIAVISIYRWGVVP